jgi:hypothetical protein
MQAIAFAKSMHPDCLIGATACDEEQPEFLHADWNRFAVRQKLGIEPTVIDSPYQEVAKAVAGVSRRATRKSSSRSRCT